MSKNYRELFPKYRNWCLTHNASAGRDGPCLWISAFGGSEACQVVRVVLTLKLPEAV